MTGTRFLGNNVCDRDCGHHCSHRCVVVIVIRNDVIINDVVIIAVIINDVRINAVVIDDVIIDYVIIDEVIINYVIINYGIIDDVIIIQIKQLFSTSMQFLNNLSILEQRDATTFFSLVRDAGEVEVVGPDDVVVDPVVVPQLDLDPAAQRREHLRDHHLLVPDRLVRSFLRRSLRLHISKSFSLNCQ